MFSYFSSFLFGYDCEEQSKLNVNKLIVKQPKLNISNLPVVKDPSNFYYLSLILEEDKSWSIHGLWPQYSTNKYPKFCKDLEFSYKKLAPIIDDLEKFWYSNKGTDELFWKHEYLKHGTCNFNNMDELEYFKTTLRLYKEVINKNIPKQFFNENTEKCLIPIDRNLNVFEIDYD